SLPARCPNSHSCARPKTAPCESKPGLCRSWLAPGQSLKYINCAACGDGIGQSDAIPNGTAVDKDRHVPAQRRLFIKHVGSHLRMGRETITQNFPHAAAGGLGLRTNHMTLNIRGEDDLCHPSLSRNRFCLAELCTCFKDEPTWPIPTPGGHRAKFRIDRRQR